MEDKRRVRQGYETIPFWVEVIIIAIAIYMIMEIAHYATS